MTPSSRFADTRVWIGLLAAVWGGAGCSAAGEEVTPEVRAFPMPDVPTFCGAEAAEVGFGDPEFNGTSGPLPSLAPLAQMVEGIEAAIARYSQQADAGGWPRIPSGPTLDPGTSHPRIALLRARLVATGELPAAFGAGSVEDPERYDPPLEAAVLEFQRTHGLAEDGRVGVATLAALNVSAQARVRQLQTNLRRIRDFPSEPGEHHIVVNVPAFGTWIYAGGVERLRLRTIVGRPSRPTPIFSATLTHLILSPFWHVPPLIAIRDQLPKIQADRGHLTREGMLLLDQTTGRTVNPNSIAWSEITGAEFNRLYRIQQNPGPRNAMGHVKFMFPNPHHVYLHDTPNRELFDEPARAFSSGCMRVDRALELAEYFLASDPAWTPERMQGVIEAGREVRVNLPTAYRIHIQYWTAFVDRQGTLHFREDLYRRDGI
jgi:L,D-transpeptidase YcbB